MKKIILFILIVLAGLVQVNAGDGHTKKSRAVPVSSFDQLLVSANVTVVLYESADIKTVLVKGRKSYAGRVSVIQNGDRLLITSGSGADMKKHVTVFVPVNRLRLLSVTDKASVRSQTILQSSVLELSAEGLGEISLIINGTVSIRKGDQHASVRPIRPEQVITKLIMPVL